MTQKDLQKITAYRSILLQLSLKKGKAEREKDREEMECLRSDIREVKNLILTIQQR